MYENPSVFFDPLVCRCFGLKPFVFVTLVSSVFRSRTSSLAASAFQDLTAIVVRQRSYTVFEWVFDDCCHRTTGRSANNPNAGRSRSTCSRAHSTDRNNLIFSFSPVRFRTLSSFFRSSRVTRDTIFSPSRLCCLIHV